MFCPHFLCSCHFHALRPTALSWDHLPGKRHALKPMYFCGNRTEERDEQDEVVYKVLAVLSVDSSAPLCVVNLICQSLNAEVPLHIQPDMLGSCEGTFRGLSLPLTGGSLHWILSTREQHLYLPSHPPGVRRLLCDTCTVQVGQQGQALGLVVVAPFLWVQDCELPQLLPKDLG